MSPTSRKRIASFPAALAAIESGFERTGERSYSGYVFDPRQPDRTFAVELLVDGYPVALTRADLARPDLGSTTAGDTCHGFRFVLDLHVEPETIVEARIANLGTPVGSPITAATQPTADPGPGAIRWNGGLRFSGWLAATADGGDDRATVSVDGQLVTEVRPSGWVRTDPESEDSPPARVLDFHLPERFADGRLHRLAVSGPGAGLAGCPLAFLAFPQGFAKALTGDGAGEISRAEFLDRLVPMSLPFSSYRDWSARLPLPAASVEPVSVGVVAVGSGEMEDTLDSLEAQTLAGWVAASLSPTDAAFGIDIPEVRAFLAGDAAQCELFVFAPAGTRLAADALQRIAAALLPVEHAHVAYADVEIVAADGSSWPVFFPGFDYDRLLEQGYCCLFFAMRRAALEAALDAGASDLYRLFNSVHDGGPAPEAVLHLPGALATLAELDLAAAGETLARASRAHLARRTIGAEVVAGAGSIFPAARVRRNPEPGMATVVIATRNRAEPLRRCLASIEAAVAAASARVIVVDNASTDPAAREHLAGLASEVTVLRLDEIRSMAAVANIGVTAADTGLVCLLGDQVEALDDDWLQELAGRAADPDVGAVGPLMLAPQGMVASAGIVLGPDFAAAPAFADRAEGDPGYGDLLKVAHQQSGLAASCLLVRRADWTQVCGMDETSFPARFAPLDLCLKLRALGRRIVITPHARLLDHRPDEPLSTLGRPTDVRLERELANLRARWGETLAADPFYSPLLSLDGAPFAALAWPPRPIDARTLGVVEAGAIPPGF